MIIDSRTSTSYAQGCPGWMENAKSGSGPLIGIYRENSNGESSATRRNGKDPNRNVRVKDQIRS